MDKGKLWSRQPDSLGPVFLWILLQMLVLFLIAPLVADAQVTTNITSSGLNTTITQDVDPNIHNITGGTRPGGGPNLFHSFGNFSVGAGDTANFSNDSGLPASNIIGRVTGGNISQIYGTIDTTDFGTANLFLMNPSGIVLGPSASLNVGGSVSFTTAQYLRLFDGVGSANFYANPANDVLATSILTIDPGAFTFLNASPAAYGFRTAPDPNATITVQGSNMSVLLKQSISLVGGNVMIEGGAQLSAPSGKILLASAASPGEFDATTLQSLPNMDGASFTSFGTVSLASNSSIDVHEGNTVWIKGGQLLLSVNDATLSTSETPPLADTIALSQDSSIVSSNSGPDLGADVQITVRNLNLDGAGTKIATETFGDGNGGNLTANVSKLSLTNSAAINSTNISFGLSQGGMITVQGLQGPGTAADSVMLVSGGQLTTQMWLGQGQGGDINITANTLLIHDSSLVTSDTLFGTGEGGHLILNIKELTVSGGSIVRTSDSSFGFDGDFDGVIDPGSVGAGGNLTIQGIKGSAADSVVLSGGSLVGTQTEDGTGGSLFIKTSVLSLDEVPLDGGPPSIILTSTARYGRGGDIDVRVREAGFGGGATIASRTQLFDPAAGRGGNITLQALDGGGLLAESVTISGFFSGITSSSFGLASPGDIAVYAKTVSLTDGAVIEGGNDFTTGTGGNVTINAGLVSITEASEISSRAFGLDAGQVTITADQLTLDHGSIKTTTASPVFGRGGDVVVDVGSMSLANGSAINSSTTGTGQAGNINVLARGSVKMKDGSTISANSTGPPNAGNIMITSGSTFLMENSSVTTEASDASGGQVTINARNMIRLIDSTVSTSVAGAANDSNGGNISIDPDFVILKGSQILAQAVAGTGGAIDITAGLFLADPSSVVDASSTLGVSGTVQINAPINNLSEVISRLPESLIEVQALLRAACAARMAEGGTSSFVERGRDSIPAGPEGLLASPYLPMTSEHLSRWPVTPSRELSNTQVRRLSGKESPAPVVLRSESAACSS